MCQTGLIMLLRCFLADMNVGYVLDETQLTRYFSQFGTVTDCYLPVSRATSRTGRSYIPPANTNSRAKVFLRVRLHYFWLCILGAGQSFLVRIRIILHLLQPCSTL